MKVDILLKFYLRLALATLNNVSVASETNKLKNQKKKKMKQWDCQQQGWLQLFIVLLRFHCRNNMKRDRFFSEPDEVLILLSSCFAVTGKVCVLAPWQCLGYCYSKLPGCAHSFCKPWVESVRNLS